jgi:4-hydroxy-tetrahydrodipicolinate reductase
MSPLRLAIIGATGRMGRVLVRLCAGDAGLCLTAAVTAPGDPLLGRDAGVIAGSEALQVPLTIAVTAPCDAVIEFAAPAATATWATWCAAHGIPLVSGTTGLDETQQAALHAAATRIPLVWAPNMSIGINLLLSLVADVAARLGPEWDIEIVETHHRGKVDAPSGTAGALLQAAAGARQQDARHVAIHGRQGQCGPRRTGEIGIHAVRGGAVVGEHQVRFFSDTETVLLEHRAFSRDTFAAGALRAARWVQGRAAGLYSMQDVLAG